MKLILTTKNEIDEVGIEALKEELGVSLTEALKGAIYDKFQQLYDQLVKSNQEAYKHSNLTWEIHYEY